MKVFQRRVWVVIAVVTLAATPVLAQRGPGFGQGKKQGQRLGRGPGPGLGHRAGGHGAGHDDRHDADRELFQFLLANHKNITRTVKELPHGVETVTESTDPEIAAKIKEHVQWMKVRIEQTKPIRMRDPLFAELFKHTDKIKMEYEDTDQGVRVVETSLDPYVAKLIKAHAKAVSGFVNRGFAEAMKNHTVPDRHPGEKVGKYINPVIKKYGKVVRMPTALAQPRSGTKICVDVTAGGSAAELNPAIEKVARFVNIYQGAGQNPADAQISLVLHGDATLAVLNDDAYAEEFGTEGNPHLDCLHDLHEAGVEIFVCGQSLVSQGARPDEVVVFVDVAVSSLTAVVNHQIDGYSMVQIR